MSLTDVEQNAVNDDPRVTVMRRSLVKYDCHQSAFVDPTRCRIGQYDAEHRRRFYEKERQRRRALRKQIFCGFMNLIFIQPFIFLYHQVMRNKRER